MSFLENWAGVKPARDDNYRFRLPVKRKNQDNRHVGSSDLEVKEKNSILFVLQKKNLNFFFLNNFMFINFKCLILCLFILFHFVLFSFF